MLCSALYLASKGRHCDLAGSARNGTALMELFRDSVVGSIASTVRFSSDSPSAAGSVSIVNFQTVPNVPYPVPVVVYTFDDTQTPPLNHVAPIIWRNNKSETGAPRGSGMDSFAALAPSSRPGEGHSMCCGSLGSGDNRPSALTALARLCLPLQSSQFCRGSSRAPPWT